METTPKVLEIEENQNTKIKNFPFSVFFVTISSKSLCDGMVDVPVLGTGVT